jgi:NAD(P)-dependent dehydrogenase (short-subunit alcohol dehydrogenase family)
MPYIIDLSGKVAVVTGGSGVLGSAMCVALANAGASVAVLGTSLDKAQKTVDTITAAGGKAIPLAADVLDKSALQAAYDAVIDEWGTVDILINCAGGNKPEAMTSPDNSRSFFDLPEEALVAYAAAKAAINNFTQWMAIYFAREYGPGIRVNAIAPGFFITTQNLRIVTNEDGSFTPRGQLIVDNTPMGRFGEPEELIGALMWLVSDGAKFVTGTIVPVDGGFSAFGGV